MELRFLLTIFSNVCLLRHQLGPVAANGMTSDAVTEYVPIKNDATKFCATSSPSESLSVGHKLRCSLECQRHNCVGLNYHEHNGICDLFMDCPSHLTENIAGCQYFQTSSCSNFKHLTASNLAQGQPTWQSSLYYDHSSGLAVNGNKNTVFNNENCACTNGIDNNPWWAVDLGQLTNVAVVVVTSRGACCPDRNENLVIGLTNVSPATTAPTRSNVVVCVNGPAEFGAGLSIALQCAPGLAPAQYVVILGSTPYLTLCEVEVYGS